MYVERGLQTWKPMQEKRIQNSNEQLGEREADFLSPCDNDRVHSGRKWEKHQKVFHTYNHERMGPKDPRIP